jgi:hypothetical protein
VLERRADLGGYGSMLGHQIFHRVGAQPRPAGRWEQHLLVTTRWFAPPCFQDGDCGFGEGRTPLLAALADDADVSARAEGHIVPGEPRQFGQPESRLDGHQEQRMIAAAEPRTRTGRGEQRVDFGPGEK